MMNKTRHILWFAVFLLFGPGAILNSSAGETDSEHFFFAGPTGVWLLNVEFPAVPGAPEPPPPFKETLTIHALGTVSESNTLLNENSYDPASGAGCGFTGFQGAPELNCNGSDGTGFWRRTGRNTFAFVFIKLVFDGATNEHVGYLRVRGDRVRFRKNKLKQVSEFSLTEFLIGTDFDTAVPIPLGGAKSTGQRIR